MGSSGGSQVTVVSSDPDTSGSHFTNDTVVYTIPAGGGVGNLVVLFAGGYGHTTGAGVATDATGDFAAASPNPLAVSTLDVSGSVLGSAMHRTIDGTEDASYTIGFPNVNNWSQGVSVRVANQTGTPAYFPTSGGPATTMKIPAFNAGANNLALLWMVGNDTAPPDLTAQGWTLLESVDAGFSKLWGKAVSANASQVDTGTSDPTGWVSVVAVLAPV